MAVEAGVLPVRVVLGLGGKAGTFHVWGQQTVGIETQQIADVGTLIEQELAVAKTHLVDVKGLYFGFKLCTGRSDVSGKHNEGKKLLHLYFRFSVANIRHFIHTEGKQRIKIC